MIKLLSFVPLLLLVSSCATTINSNVGDFVIGSTKKNIAKQEVVELTMVELHQRYFQTLGAVESVACTFDRDQRLPNLKEMKKRLKVEAFNNGANVMVFDSCKEYADFQSCDQYKSCSAQIFNADI
jgi:hypothetical protein